MVFEDLPERGARKRPLGADLAGYLVTSLRDRGAHIDDPPVSAGGGWRSMLSFEGAQFVVVVEVASLRNSKEDVWLVRVQRHYGFWQTLLGRGRTLEEALPLCRELGVILGDGDVFQGVEWLGRE
jgi:hypothetical protein